MSEGGREGEREREREREREGGWGREIHRERERERETERALIAIKALGTCPPRTGASFRVCTITITNSSSKQLRSPTIEILLLILLNKYSSQ